MKFLVDESLSPKLARLLSDAGHDAVHLRERGMQGSEDPEVIALARSEARILISADADFGTLLTLGAERTPSLIYFRGDFDPAAPEQARQILASLPEISNDLENGAIVVVSRSKVRIRLL